MRETFSYAQKRFVFLLPDALLLGDDEQEEGSIATAQACKMPEGYHLHAELESCWQMMA